MSYFLFFSFLFYSAFLGLFWNRDYGGGRGEGVDGGDDLALSHVKKEKKYKKYKQHIT